LVRGKNWSKVRIRSGRLQSGQGRRFATGGPQTDSLSPSSPPTQIALGESAAFFRSNSQSFLL
jgi:hypothetical protein